MFLYFIYHFGFLEKQFENPVDKSQTSFCQRSGSQKWDNKKNFFASVWIGTVQWFKTVFYFSSMVNSLSGGTANTEGFTRSGSPNQHWRLCCGSKPSHRKEEVMDTSLHYLLQLLHVVNVICFTDCETFDHIGIVCLGSCYKNRLSVYLCSISYRLASSLKLLCLGWC